MDDELGGSVLPPPMSDVVCPFCAMACDDLTVARARTGQLRVTANGCARARTLFALPALPAHCFIKGRAVPLDEALDAAAALLRNAISPAVGGLAADTEGISAALALAERLGAVVDHATSDSLFHGLRALQVTGAMTATFGELRNRADLFVLFGTEFDRHAPRLFDRIVRPPTALFREAGAARGYLIGPGDGPMPEGFERLSADLIHAPAIAAALSQLVAGERPRGQRVGGIAMEDLARVATALREARFGVVGWVAATLDPVAGDVAIEAFNRLVVTANASTRCAGLPLGGKGNALGANYVCAWQYGVPLRSRLGAGPPEHDPLRYRLKSLLAGGEVDALVWLSALNGAEVPDTRTPMVVLARPGQPLPYDPEVLIPVVIPGLDHAGSIHRGDGVAALPLRRLRSAAATLPTAATVLNALLDRLPASPLPVPIRETAHV
ncbi:formylmethanofuran dehydrogenase [Azospirillum lipoferum]|uniref:Formylmethanofuran dehydrogenase n=1 Tax=Azospirillum lipoferum TaxID=193 RepID=A0A5A9GIQ2_AZOLI|nr:formylmethanofuran dehydrogenase [Azospirillum lipoferum]KAA0594320.1 formylmethanofuran dehydrogenase [Azospirillum lipoferum]